MGIAVFPEGERAPVARFGLGAVAAACAVVLFAFITEYGFFGDELYFLAAGRRLSAGYADQGPALPAIAAFTDWLAPGSLVALRTPPALITIGAVLVTGLLAREFGGGRGAQVLAAAGYATSPLLLWQGHMLATNTVDTALWVLTTWCVVRWVRTGLDRWLLVAAVVTAVDLQVKWLIPVFWVCVGVCALVFGPRRLLARPALWFGAGIVVLSMIPSLLWQAAHGWPQLALTAEVAQEEAYAGGRLLFVPVALATAGVLGLLLLGYGLWRMFRAESLRPYRFLAGASVLVLLVFLAAGGRPYYVAGLFGILMAAGAVELTRRNMRVWGKCAVAVLTAASVAVLVSSLPWRPASEVEPMHGLDDIASKLTTNGQFGWHELTAATSRAYRQLPEQQRKNAVVVASSYWQAAAIEQFGPDFGLPKVYSPNRGFGYFGRPPARARTVIVVGAGRHALDSTCRSVQRLARSVAPKGIPGSSDGVPIWRCTNPVQPWSRLWPQLRSM